MRHSGLFLFSLALAALSPISHPVSAQESGLWQSLKDCSKAIYTYEEFRDGKLKKRPFPGEDVFFDWRGGAPSGWINYNEKISLNSNGTRFIWTPVSTRKVRPMVSHFGTSKILFGVLSFQSEREKRYEHLFFFGQDGFGVRLEDYYFKRAQSLAFLKGHDVFLQIRDQRYGEDEPFWKILLGARPKPRNCIRYRFSPEGFYQLESFARGGTEADCPDSDADDGIIAKRYFYDEDEDVIKNFKDTLERHLNQKLYALNLLANLEVENRKKYVLCGEPTAICKSELFQRAYSLRAQFSAVQRALETPACRSAHLFKDIYAPAQKKIEDSFDALNYLSNFIAELDFLYERCKKL